MKEVLYASFPNGEMAEKAVGALLDNGVKPEDISLIFNEAYGKTRTGASVTLEGKDVVENAKGGITTTTAADAGVGAAKGAGVGLGVGTVALLASLFIPGVGLVTGAGALATAIVAAAGTTAAGAVAGGMVGFLKDQGMPEEAAFKYNQEISGGGAMIAIALPTGEVTQVTIRQILSKYQGTNLNSHNIR